MKIKIVRIKKTGKAYYATKVPNGWKLIKRAPEHDKSTFSESLRDFGEVTYHVSGAPLVVEPVKGFIKELFS